ncbi:hypothetical protein B4107_0308 [Bacillus safensis]|nr:hypothetical protein B4107_0308 [Bacillus safensis]
MITKPMTHDKKMNLKKYPSVTSILSFRMCGIYIFVLP